MVQTEFLGRLLLSVFIIVMILLLISVLLPQFFGSGLCKFQQDNEISNFISDAGSMQSGTIQKFTVDWCVNQFFLQDSGGKNYTQSGATICLNYSDGTSACTNTGGQYQQEVLFSFTTNCNPTNGKYFLTSGTYFVRLLPYSVNILCSSTQ